MAVLSWGENQALSSAGLGGVLEKLMVFTMYLLLYLCVFLNYSDESSI